MLTIVTPTYNREIYLSKLYNSLLKQTDKNFKWLIIDDGSADNTKEIIEKWKTENKIVIEYIYQKNQGKHIAYNTALDYMRAEDYHVVVDSDDFLEERAIDIFNKEIKFLENNNLCGVVFPRIDVKNNNIVNWLTNDISKINIPDIFLRYSLNIETCILIKNNYLINFRFPCYENEKFIGEELMYIFLSEKNMFKQKYEEIYYFDYLEDGMTKNIFKIWYQNPKGTLLCLRARKKYISKNFKGILRLKLLFKVTLNIQALLLKVYGLKRVLKESNYNFFMLPFIVFWRYKRFS